MQGLLALLGALLFPSCQAAVTLEQPLSLMRPAGSSAVLPCRVRTRVSSIHWYRHQEGRAPERLLRLATANSDVQWDSVLKADKVRATYSEDGSSCSLRVLRLQKGDEGRYYCAAWDTTARRPALAATQKPVGFPFSRPGDFHPVGSLALSCANPAPPWTLLLALCLASCTLWENTTEPQVLMPLRTWGVQ